MRKIYILFAMMSIVSLTFAQRQYSVSDKKFSSDIIKFDNNIKSPTDTIMPEAMADASGFVLYNCVTGGYVCGTNGYGDVAKAQEYWVGAGEGYKIYGAVVWFGGKEIVGSAGTVACKLLPMNGTATGANGSIAGPGSTALASASISTSAVDTSSTMTFTAFNFTSPYTIQGDYALSIDFSSTGNDTLGIISTADGDGLNYELTFEKWNDGSWYSILGAWPLDFDMCIFPVVEMNTGMEDVFVDGVKMSMYPNPASELSTISYEIQKSANVTFYIIDANGKVVKTSEEGFKTAGAYQTTFDVSKLASGTYMYLINAGSQKVAKRFVVK